MYSFGPNEQLLVDAGTKHISWLFEVTDNSATTHYWSTKNKSLNGNDYVFKVIPQSFSGVTLRRGRSEYGFMAPGEVKFSISNSSNTLSAADFEGSIVVVRLALSETGRLLLEDGDKLLLESGGFLLLEGAAVRSFRFFVRRCESVAQRLVFHCESFLHQHLDGDWPNTPLLADLAKEGQGANPNDGMCVPVTVGTAYLPIRSLNITNDRFYLLGPADVTYTVDEVRAPWGGENAPVWTSAGYTMTQSTKTLNGVDYRMVQPLIADGAVGLWRENGRIADMPCKWSNSGTAGLTNPVDWLTYVLEDMGVPSALIDTTTAASVKAELTSRGVAFNGGYWYRRSRSVILAEILNQAGITINILDKIYFRLLDKTSLATFGRDDILRTDPEKPSTTYSYSGVTRTDEDSGYIAFSSTVQNVLHPVLVTAKATTAYPSSGQIQMPLLQDSVVAQKNGCLQIQRKIGRKAQIQASIKWSNIALDPEDVVTISHADYGGPFPAVVDEISFKSRGPITVSLVRYKYALDNWADLAFSPATVDDPDAATAWSTITVGPEASATSGVPPNVLPGILRIGNTSDHILLHPTDGITVHGAEQTA